jgi:hypothetical protein
MARTLFTMIGPAFQGAPQRRRGERRSTSCRSSRAAFRSLAGSPGRSARSTARSKPFGMASCHSPARSSCGPSQCRAVRGIGRIWGVVRPMPSRTRSLVQSLTLRKVAIAGPNSSAVLREGSVGSQQQCQQADEQGQEEQFGWIFQHADSLSRTNERQGNSARLAPRPSSGGAKSPQPFVVDVAAGLEVIDALL